MPTNTQRLITLFRGAQRQNRLSLSLGYLALGCFGLFGTLASLPTFKDSVLIYLCFHYLPYVLIGLSIPFSLYHIFLMVRYRIIQFMLVVIMLGFGCLLPLASAIFYAKGEVFNGSMTLFIGMIAWFCVPYLLKVSIGRFLNFLYQNPAQENQKDIAQ